ncbi:uncharacterized protein LOC117174197 [Belonocnema kinseyi]|uniref:uncharacterized protein LOC117174197 n=1 Tax=Belonocnema kinseyi TaxID=2817044 RepID=UPI00143D4C57|nr:uncharacterized protein LOC117174197 [Belonocnema kinseyi]
MPEERGSTNVVSRLKLHIKELPFFCKVIELVCCIISIALLVGALDNKSHKQLMNFHHVGLIFTSISGYILINSIIIVCYLIGEKQPKKMALLFAALGCLLCFASGVVLIYDWDKYDSNFIFQNSNKYLDQMLSSGIFAILASVVFALDTHFIKKYD